jgi:putative SOS response-associated peptidase YedK
MIITEANDFVREVHDRMPVILAAGSCDVWLAGNGWDADPTPLPTAIAWA